MGGRSASKFEAGHPCLAPVPALAIPQASDPQGALATERLKVLESNRAIASITGWRVLAVELERIDPDTGAIAAGHLLGGASPHLLGLLILWLRRRGPGLGGAAGGPGLAPRRAPLGEGVWAARSEGAMYLGPVMAADSRAPEERGDHVGVTGYLKALAYLSFTMALGGALATALWSRPPLVYWPLLVAMFVVYVGAMLWILRHWVSWAVSGAAVTTARLVPRPVWPAIVFPGAYFVLGFSLLGWGAAAVQPTLLGFLTVQMLVFGVLSWRGSRAVHRWESQSGSRLLMVPRLGADRSDFLVQTPIDISGDRVP